VRRPILPHLTLPLAALWLMCGGSTLAEPPAPVVRAAPATPEPPPPATTSHMQVRVFEGFDGHGGRPQARETPLALDADLELVTCPDGNVQINGVTIGGAPLAQDQQVAECNPGKGSVRFADGQQREITATAGVSSAPAARPAPATPPAPRCDPVTWRCGDPVRAPGTTPAPR
jgi:hypothetical protein